MNTSTYSVEMMLEKAFHFDVDRYKRNDRIPEILFRMKQCEVSRTQLTHIISVRYQAAHFFEDMLRRIIEVVNRGQHRLPQRWPIIDTNTRTVLREAVTINLAEELGQMAEYGGPHHEGREVFLTALGIDYVSWKAKLGTYNDLGDLDPSVRFLVNRMKWIIELGPLEALVALWYYENRISMDHTQGDYHILLRAFEVAFPEFKKPESKYVEGDPLWHIASHADHDEHHAQLARDALMKVEGVPLFFESIENGILETRKAIDFFWCLLSERHFGNFQLWRSLV